MRLILNVHHTPTIFPCAHGFTTDDHFPFGTDHGEWDHFLHECEMIKVCRVLTHCFEMTYPNVLIELHFLVIVIVSIKRIEADALVEEFPPNL